MIEWLDSTVLYWHWIVIGLLLITFEMLVPVFVLLWLGIAALTVGFLLSVFPMGISAQLTLWVILSFLLVALWHRFVSPRISDRTLAGLSREAIVGQVGLVIFFNREDGRGKLKFPAPIVGNDEWEFICTGTLNHGDKVEVKDISGNSLIVKPLH
ncbi:MAG: hypothetical protein ACJA04_000488 [Cellvibrionaceae bacterium]|jgi:membrane protein implicated in regulation of membrane protease activity